LRHHIGLATRRSRSGKRTEEIPIVTEFAFLLEIAASTAMIVAPVIVLNRLLAGADGPTLADVFAIPVDPPWPRGVQEEEPLRWRLDRLERRKTPAAVAAPIAGDCLPHAHRPSTVRGGGIG
jgi:hypothetical protein